MRAPRLPSRSLAPASTTERASSMALSAGSATLLYRLVRDGGPGRLHARDAAHPATAVGGRAGVVQAAHRGPVVGETGRWPQVEQLLEGQLAMEDVAADQAVVVLHVVGADDVPVQDRRLEVRRYLVVAVDHPVRVPLELLAVRLLVPVGR